MKTRDFVVGLLFLGAVVLLGMLTVLVTGFQWGETQYPMSVTFSDVAGLSDGDPVRVHGYKAGEVKTLEYTPSGIVVTMILTKNIPPTQGYSFIVKSSSALGGNFVEYEPGNGKPLSASEREELHGSSRELFAQLEKLLADNRESIRKIISNVQELSDQAAQGPGLVHTILTDEKLAEDVKSGVHSIQQIAKNVESGLSSDDSLANAILHDEKLTASARKIVDNTEKATGNIEKITSDIQAGKGILGRVAKDEDMGKKFGDIVDKADELVTSARDGIDEIRHGKGIIARLINDPEWSDKIDSLLTNASDIAAKINKGEGSLSKLLNDEALYKQLTGLVTLARETLEDYREQAPVNTFVTVLFNAF